jgi:hypothetical protein
MVAIVPVAVEAVVPFAAVAGVAAAVSSGLSLPAAGLLHLLYALGLLTLRRLLALCLRFALHPLSVLWLCLALCLLLMLWLRLALRRLGLSAASPLFLISFLCERRKGGTEK